MSLFSSYIFIVSNCYFTRKSSTLFLVLRTDNQRINFRQTGSFLSLRRGYSPTSFLRCTVSSAQRCTFLLHLKSHKGVYCCRLHKSVHSQDSLTSLITNICDQVSLNHILIDLAQHNYGFCCIGCT